jgi:hypothetical protein
MGDLEEVDFRGAARDRDIARDPRGAIAEIEATVEDIRRRVKEEETERERWRRWERRVLFARIKTLRRQLQLERANQFTDAEVLAALREFDGEVHAADVAARLLRVPTHSAVVRVGLALGRLNRAGHVGRIRPTDASRAHRWFLAERSDA